MYFVTKSRMRIGNRSGEGPLPLSDGDANGGGLCVLQTAGRLEGRAGLPEKVVGHEDLEEAEETDLAVLEGQLDSAEVLLPQQPFPQHRAGVEEEELESSQSQLPRCQPRIHHTRDASQRRVEDLPTRPDSDQGRMASRN